MGILRFDGFINEVVNRENIKRTAGVAVICDNRILLVHPTNSGWKNATCGIPKGGINVGEEPLDAALRELREEVGIVLSPSHLNRNVEVVNFYNKNREFRGQLIYYVAVIPDLSEIGLSSYKLPKSQLQQEEVDWAKFVSPKEAYEITARGQLIILDRHLNLRLE